jgi:hypothetical protein
MSQLSCSSFTAGIVEAVLDGLSFVRDHHFSLLRKTNLKPLFLQPARVTAHNTPTSQYSNRTTILIKLEKSVLDREELLKQ